MERSDAWATACLPGTGPCCCWKGYDLVTMQVACYSSKALPYEIRYLFSNSSCRAVHQAIAMRADECWNGFSVCIYVGTFERRPERCRCISLSSPTGSLLRQNFQRSCLEQRATDTPGMAYIPLEEQEVWKATLLPPLRTTKFNFSYLTF